MVCSKDFVNHFIKVGISERDKDRNKVLREQRQIAADRAREEEEKLAGQWAKMELDVGTSFTVEEKEAALEKITDVATKYDPSNPGPMGLKAFTSLSMSPAVFREMLKRSFNLTVSY